MQSDEVLVGVEIPFTDEVQVLDDSIEYELPSVQTSHVNGSCEALQYVVVMTSAQSNLTTGRIAAGHGRFSGIHQVTPMYTLT